MSTITFADVAHQSISFSEEIPSQALVLELVNTPWFQRLRDISQTANTRLVYMFSEHSRFGHSLGVAYLADMLMDKLSSHYADQVARFRSAVSVAALLHDIGHMAPGSHTAFKTWFPDKPDTHEDISARVIKNDPVISKILARGGKDLSDEVIKVLSESSDLPSWTWQIISGGGWNVDRGNWCIVDSILAGVSYGKYNIPALTESIVITPDGTLALNENRLDAMMHFAISRHAMYRQIYQHRAILATDTINKAIVMRARDLGNKIPFADSYMKEVLCAASPEDLSLDTIFFMRESWWRYHLLHWMTGNDPILADLSRRLIDRDLFKTVRVQEEESFSDIHDKAAAAIKNAGFDPKYYLHSVSTKDMHASDYDHSMKVLMDNNQVKTLAEAEPLFNSLVRESRNAKKVWLVMPKEAKKDLGRVR